MDMSEKGEAEGFEDDEVDELLEGGDDVDLDRVGKDLDLAKRHARPAGDPAWRRLEKMREQKEFAELVSDFEDYDIEKVAVGRARRAAR